METQNCENIKMMNEVCRICLATHNLFPIFLSTDTSNYATDISNVTGTTIEPNDGLPQAICEECAGNVQSAMLLRAKSKQSEKCLIIMGFKRVQIHLHKQNANECLADSNHNEKKSEHDCLLQFISMNEDDVHVTASNHSDVKLSEVEHNAIKVEIKHENYEPQTSHIDIENKKQGRVNKKTKGANRSIKRSKQKKKPDMTSVQNISSQKILPEGIDLNVEVKLEAISTDEQSLDSPRINTDDENVEEHNTVHTKEINHTTKTKVKNKPMGKQKKEKGVQNRINDNAESAVMQTFEVKSGYSNSDYLGYLDGAYSKKGPYVCKECKLKWTIWNSFKVHVKRKHFKHTLICEYCARSFVTKTSLDRHCRSFHGMRRQLACPDCDFLALDRKQLVLHTRHAHTGEKPFVCDACNTSFYDRRCLIQHIEGHRTTLDVKCPSCDGVFKSRRHLARHVFTAHASKRYHYRCSGCNNVYTNRKYARRHLTKLHPDLIATSKAALISIEI